MRRPLNANLMVEAIGSQRALEQVDHRVKEEILDFIELSKERNA